MRLLAKNLRTLATDERGGAAMGYALILSLIVVTAAAVVTTVGGRVLAESAKKAVK